MSDTPMSDGPKPDIPSSATEPPRPITRRGGVPRWAKRAAIGVIAAIVLFFGAIFVYAKVINDSPDEFSAADIDAALTGESGGSTAAGNNWAATDASQVGYRVDEVLFGVDTTAVGRTNQVTGSLTIDGTRVTTSEFTVDVASIASDESRRDNQFRGRIMSADEFPTATFVLTEPIELGSEPGDGVEVTATATGELALRGATQPVTFEVTAKQDNGLIGVQGSIPVVFADYGIANPSFGGVSTEDNGLVEFVLVFEPA
jgi:polyisoprenoid-binding protein YceI